MSIWLSWYQSITKYHSKSYSFVIIEKQYCVRHFTVCCIASLYLDSNTNLFNVFGNYTTILLYREIHGAWSQSHIRQLHCTSLGIISTQSSPPPKKKRLHVDSGRKERLILVYRAWTILWGPCLVLKILLPEWDMIMTRYSQEMGLYSSCMWYDISLRRLLIHSRVFLITCGEWLELLWT